MLQKLNKPFHPDDSGMRPFNWRGPQHHVDDSGMTWHDQNQNQGRGNNQGNQPPDKGAMIQPFLPGQRGLLSQQLAAGFGGKPSQFAGLLNDTYSPMQMPSPFQYGAKPDRNGGNGGNQGDQTGDYKPTPQDQALWANYQARMVNGGGLGALAQLSPQARAYFQSQGTQPDTVSGFPTYHR